MKFIILAAIFIVFLIYKIFILSRHYIRTGIIGTSNEYVKWNINSTCAGDTIIQTLLLLISEWLIYILPMMVIISIAVISVSVYVFCTILKFLRKNYIKKECIQSETIDKR